jgi:hypothetical protein
VITGVVKIDDFHLTYLSQFLFRYKLGATLDFGLRIADFGIKEFCLF